MKEISIKIWLPILIIVSISVSLATFYSWPREEKPLEIVMPEVPEEITPPEGISWNVPAGEVNQKIEREVKRIIYSDPYFVSLAENLREKGQLISFESLRLKGKCAIIGYLVFYEQTKEPVPTAGLVLILKNVNGKWENIGFCVYDCDYSVCEE